jgi:putative phosphoesterase
MRIGVISDTHGFLDPAVPGIFRGVEHILHAGDIGSPSIIAALGKIAPVTAVLGNNDAGLNFNETELVVLNGRKFLVHHIVSPSRLQDEIRLRLERDRPDVVVFGHTHQPFNQTLERTLFFNPGYAGRPRFNSERSVAVLHCDPGSLTAEFSSLPRETR